MLNVDRGIREVPNVRVHAYTHINQFQKWCSQFLTLALAINNNNNDIYHTILFKLHCTGALYCNSAVYQKIMISPLQHCPPSTFYFFLIWSLMIQVDGF